MDALTRRQLLQSAGAGGLAIGVLGACGGATPSKPVDHLTWVSTTLQTLDMAKADYGIQVHVLATEPVLVHDDKLGLVGHLAESWKTVDPVTYTYKVRSGVRFWDGSPLTAEDLAFAMRRHIDPKVASLLAGIVPPVDAIEVTGDDEVTVRLKKPNATWAQLPTLMLVGSKAYYERYGKDFGAPGGKIMGTGPYVVRAFKADDSVEYERNERYWGRKPIARKLRVAMIADSQTQLLAARAGEVDGTFELAAETIPQWRRLGDIGITSAPGANISFASFDVTKEPWNDVHVRRAFAHAFDRQGMLKALLRGNGEIVNSIVPRSQWGAAIPKGRLDEIYASLRVYDFDLGKAREELAQSSHPNGLTAGIWYYNHDRPRNVALAWASNLKQIGVTLKLEPVSDEEGDARESEHRDLGLSVHAEWTPYYPDPIDRPLTLLPSSAAKQGGYNEANYRNSLVDRLIEENLASTDVDRRADLLAQIMKIAAEDLPYLPLWTTNGAVAMRRGLRYRGFSPWFETQSWIERVEQAA
jgi:peptide/nickel transport system substrate-binding protein